MAVGTDSGRLVAPRDAPVGGQAVMEGVMMRGVGTWAVAVRKPTGETAVSSFPLTSVARSHRGLRLPIVRGVVALAESMAIGFRALTISANAQVGDEDEDIPAGSWVLAIVLGVLLAVGLFFVVPVTLTSLIKDRLGSPLLFWLVEGVLRTTIFLIYLIAVSRVRDLRRVFEYHGAEHKTIACLEAGAELTPAQAQRFSRLHPRCGTSFLLIVMVVAIFAFAPVGLPAWYWLVATRILGVPLIVGVSYEVIRLTARHRSRPWARALIWPGMQLQKLTTREPDLGQLAVAIAALDAVLAVETPGLRAGDLVGVEVVA